ncbi:MAG: aminotransferase class V-fold PLP-dependent enzyme [Treponema sp.]|jgi:cysteine desulfurase|nr:aminotransferase class V-fold PLP-dependent enzyme [Treponema sp.]
MAENKIESQQTPRRVYVDYNATTPLKPAVKAAVIEDLEVYGNASSMHASGRLAHARVEQARSAVEKLLGAPAGTVIFTSGGSESNNTVFQAMRRLASGPDGRPLAAGRNEFITTAIEHPCVLNSAQYLKSLGFKVIILPVDGYGKLRMDELQKVLSDKTLFVSVMAANNEIGTIQNIKEIAGMARAAGAWMHTDAVQAVGKIPLSVEDLGVDYLTMSAHKIYGPKGVGALYVRKGAPLSALIHGGHQEDGLRAGTYNNIGILGFGRAAAIAAAEVETYGREISALRDRLRAGLAAAIPSIKINGHPDDLLPNTLNVSFPGAEGEAILLSMDIMGIEASTGSACASGSLEPSHVLLAIGVGPELAHGSIRFSLGWGNSAGDIDYIIETLPPIIARLRAMSTLTPDAVH